MPPRPSTSVGFTSRSSCAVLARRASSPTACCRTRQRAVRNTPCSLQGYRVGASVGRRRKCGRPTPDTPHEHRSDGTWCQTPTANGMPDVINEPAHTVTVEARNRRRTGATNPLLHVGALSGRNECAEVGRRPTHRSLSQFAIGAPPTGSYLRHGREGGSSGRPFNSVNHGSGTS